MSVIRWLVLFAAPNKKLNNTRGSDSPSPKFLNADLIPSPKTANLDALLFAVALASANSCMSSVI